MNRARLLRERATAPERSLWRHLRNRNFAGYKFRRQHPLDPYTLDLLSLRKARGRARRWRTQLFSGPNHDRTRATFLAQHGILVLRFWNHQVRKELDSVLQAIWLALERRCGKNPSP